MMNELELRESIRQGIVALDGDGESVLILDFDYIVGKWC